MRYLPLFVDIADKSVAVAGGGAQALQKTTLLLRAGAAPTIFAADPAADLAALIAEKNLVWHPRTCRETDLTNQALLLIADTPHRDAADLAAAATQRRIPVNAVDQPALSTVIMPGFVDRDPILVAIHSAGAAPILVRNIRAQIESLLPANLGSVARFAARFRPAVRRAFPTAEQRRQFWESFFSGDIVDNLLAGRRHRASRQMLRLVNKSPESALKKAGHVALVGVGPGDPDLLTLKAVRLMQRADVVLYDALIPPAIFEHVRRDAVRINVGKRRGRHKQTQDGIHELMRAHAMAGRRVVRLKGGDPFIFGRGGEELLHLQAHGIATDIVPGITAAAGAAASSGIPLTHRGVATGVQFLTGHFADDTNHLPPAMLRNTDQTSVIYMGLHRAAAVAEAFLSAGRVPETPVAIIENATRPDETVLRCNLGSLASTARTAALSGPVLIVVGDVVALTALTERKPVPPELPAAVSAATR